MNSTIRTEVARFAVTRDRTLVVLGEDSDYGRSLVLELERGPDRTPVGIRVPGRHVPELQQAIESWLAWAGGDR